MCFEAKLPAPSAGLNLSQIQLQGKNGKLHKWYKMKFEKLHSKFRPYGIHQTLTLIIIIIGRYSVEAQQKKFKYVTEYMVQAYLVIKVSRPRS